VSTSSGGGRKKPPNDARLRVPRAAAASSAICLLTFFAAGGWAAAAAVSARIMRSSFSRSLCSSARDSTGWWFHANERRVAIDQLAEASLLCLVSGLLLGRLCFFWFLRCLFWISIRLCFFWFLCCLFCIFNFRIANRNCHVPIGEAIITVILIESFVIGNQRRGAGICPDDAFIVFFIKLLCEIHLF
jgi:hypothetical protein